MKNKITFNSIGLQEYVHDAFINLMATKLRTFLAVLGILVGAASVVAMISGGELMTRQALMQFKALGTNLLAISLNSNSSDANLPESTVLNMQNISPDILKIAPYAGVYIPMIYQGKTLQGSILGATYNLKDLMKAKIAKGRFISFLDQYSEYCVIGDDIAKQMKKINGKNPIGQQVNLHGTFFTVAGILKNWPQNSFLFADLNQSIIVPLPMSLLLSKYASINSIVLRINPKSNIDDLQTKIQTYFHQNAPDYQLYFQSPKQIIARMKAQQNILTLFLGFIGAISLIVGGIGVMNIMLVSVTERKREIGIRMAIGARRRDIRIMFLIESIMLSLFGGVLGVVLGVLISFVIAEVKGWGFTLFLIPPIIGFSISVIIGVFFGFYPAYKASKLDPIDCLRSE